jgi:hypothetical protein
MWKAKRKATAEVDFQHAVKVWLNGVGLEDFGSSEDKNKSAVSKFLNRMLGLSLTRQNMLFETFAKLVEHVVKRARREGKYDEAITELEGRRIEITDETTVQTATASRGELVHLNVETDRGIPFADARATLKAADADFAAEHAPGAPRPNFLDMRTFRAPKNHNGFYRSKNPHPIHKKHLVMMAIKSKSYTPGEGGLSLRIFRPNTGISQMSFTDVLQRYVKAVPEDLEDDWTTGFDDGDKYCSHGPKCKHGKACQVGKRTQQNHVLRGSILYAMRKAESSINAATSGAANGVKLKVCRVCETKDGGQSHVGLLIPGVYVDTVIDAMEAEDEAPPPAPAPAPEPESDDEPVLLTMDFDRKPDVKPGAGWGNWSATDRSGLYGGGGAGPFG